MIQYHNNDLMLQKKNKKIWLTAATYPEIALFKRTIMQDVVSFVEKGIFDEIFSMSYGIDNSYVYRSVSDYAEKTAEKTSCGSFFFNVKSRI